MVTADRRRLLPAGLLSVLDRQFLAGRRCRLRLHGARHGRRKARALHRRLVEMGQCLRPRHRPHPPALLVVGVDARARRPTARRSSRSMRPCCSWAIVGGYVAQRLIEGIFMRRFGDAYPCLAADRQPVPADHRAPQPEHGDPRRRPCCSAARHRHRAGRVVDDHLADLPRRPAGPGEPQRDRGEPVVSWLA